MELWVGAVNLGFLYAFMTMGVFITFRIHDFPDITVDGSFTSGAAVAAVLLTAGANPLTALGAALCIGIAAGALTALINTRFQVNGLLAGILVMTALYSINLHIMGRSNIPLLNQTTVFSWLAAVNPGLHPEVWTAVSLRALLAGFWVLAALFFKTDLGIAMRVTGNNPTMAAANGVNVGRMTIFGIALANGLVGVSGALVAQYQGFADIGMGIGTVVIGLAAVIIGESVLRAHSLFVRVLSVIIGSILFRLMIAVALDVGMNPIDLKLLTAVFVFLTLVVSASVGIRRQTPRTQRLTRFFTGEKRLLVVAVGAAAVAVAGHRFFVAVPARPAPVTIGCVQLTDNGLLNITRDSLVAELARLGYRSGDTCRILLENAHGDLPTVNSILDKFLQQNVDVVVTISTGCTQAALKKITDRPVVFATVANPFLINAGTSDTHHLPHVTGVYGWAPMDKTLELVKKILPGPITIGAIWDPAQPNSVFNVEQLQEAARAYPDVRFAGATVTGSADVHEAAASLVQKGITAFVLSPDNIVYSAFDAVVKAAQARRIPIFMNDVERLRDGALAVLGYDYTQSGTQAARLVNRILKGENPASIPFERYRTLTLGINLDAAAQAGIAVPGEVRAQATLLVGADAERSGDLQAGSAVLNKARKGTDNAMPGQRTRLALFLFSDNMVLTEVAQGIREELEHSGFLQRHGITMDLKNAQNEFSMAQSIAQDIVRQRYDYIITVSTPALQVMAQTNQKIPHVFGGVTDPYRMGVARSAVDHPPHLTGVATFQPVARTIQVMREIFPGAETIGMIWNPAEACSEACVIRAREAARQYGFKLLETNVSATGEVLDALKALLNKKPDLFLTSGDNTVIMALDSIAALLRENKIPYFTNVPADIDRGAFLGLGADYVEVGRATGKIAARVITGELAGSIPIQDYVPEKMNINTALAREYGIAVPPQVLARASRIKE